MRIDGDCPALGGVPVGGTMTYFNPLSGALVPGTQVQRAATDKERQIARSQALRKNTAAEGDRVEVEHQVESAEELAGASGENPSGGRGGRQQPRDGRDPGKEDDDRPHLDVTA